MKRSVLVLTVLVLLLFAESPPASACDQTCGVSSTPWGEEVGICLTIPEYNAFLICVPINVGPVHSCFVDTICRNGFPIY